jgi:TRAP-type uncharacterized transport system fused permease subunit
VLLGVGLIVGVFSATGLAGTLVNDLVFMAGNNVIALLIMGALTAFVFGMGMDGDGVLYLPGRGAGTRS